MSLPGKQGKTSTLNPWSTFLTENDVADDSVIQVITTDLNSDGRSEIWISCSEWAETAGRLAQAWEVYVPDNSDLYSRYAPLLDNAVWMRADTIFLEDNSALKAIVSIAPGDSLDGVQVTKVSIDAAGKLQTDVQEIKSDSEAGETLIDRSEQSGSQQVKVLKFNVAEIRQKGNEGKKDVIPLRSPRRLTPDQATETTTSQQFHDSSERDTAAEWLVPSLVAAPLLAFAFLFFAIKTLRKKAR